MKRSRKTKLVARDCSEYEEIKNMRMEELTKSLLSELETEDRELDSLPNTLQTVLPKLRTELDKTYDDNTESSTRELKFSIDIEVEECEDDDVTETYENKTSQSDDSDVELVIDEEKNSQEQQWPVFVSDREFRDSVEKLSKMTQALADKISEVHIRNYLGRCVNQEPDEIDHYTKCIQEVFPQVTYWQKLSKFREAILCYKCYVCDIGWWHMGPFRDHVKDHGEEILLSFETTSNEGCIVAHFDLLTSVKEITIEGHCWQCMKTWVEHVNLKRTTGHYYCQSCNFKSRTCLALLEHEGFCMRYHKDKIKETISYEVPCKCQICSINCITQERLNTHMTLFHFARSDFHCNPASLRRCQYCNLSYITYITHNCPKRALNVICDYCTRRFRGRFLADVHMTNTKKNVRCAICNIHLRSQCMESQHVVKHSKNYVALYKCANCPNHLFFKDERTIREHKDKHPDRKNNFYFELVIAPRKLFPRLPYSEVEMISPVKPYILGPNLAPIPEKQLSATETSIGETEKAVDALRQDYRDVHGHDYLLHTYNTVTEPQNIPSPKDDSQQQIADDTMAAIASISDATIKTEAEDYEYDQTEMDIVYEEVDIKKEEFLDTLSNAFVSTEDATDTLDNKDYSNVFKVSSHIVTVIKEEIPLYYDAMKSKEEPTPEKNEMDIVNNSEKMEAKEHSSDDDIEDDIIVLNDESSYNYTQIDDNDIDDVSIVNSVNETTDISDKINDNDIDVTMVNSANETIDIINEINDNDIDDVSIVNSVNETIDISDTEIESDVEDPKKSSKQSSETIKENDESVVINKRVKRKIYKCTKCDFKAPHKEFKNHIETKCHQSIRNSTGGKTKTPEPWPSYPCSKCNFIYPDFKTYISHLRCQKVPRETCPECLEMFTKPLQLMNHLKGHVKRMFTKIYVILENVNLQVITSVRDNVYKCKICSQVVKYRKFFKHWESHLKFETKREDKVECEIERKGEDKVGQLDHMKLSPEQLKMLLDLIRSEKPRVDPISALHPCVLCWRPFTRASYLKVHYIEHLLGDAMHKRLMFHTENIACQICNEEFNHNSTYKQHMRNHAHMPVYRCELCSHSFSDSSNFAKHKKVHNMGAMVCDVCGAKFFKKVSLVKHLQVHQKADPMKCELCLKEFCSPKLYKKHVRVAHMGKASFTCNICLEKFTSSKDRLDHMWTVHQYRKKKIDCPVCNRSFRKFMDMKNHVRLNHCTELKVKSKQFSSASKTDLASSLAGKGWAKGGGAETKMKDFVHKNNVKIEEKDGGAKGDNLPTKLETQARVCVKKCKAESVENTKKQAKGSGE